MDTFYDYHESGEVEEKRMVECLKACHEDDDDFDEQNKKNIEMMIPNEFTFTMLKNG
jgi:hypothetical protein